MTSIYDPPDNHRSAPYWDGIDHGELRFQQCLGSEAHRWMQARDACPQCGADVVWVASSGRATVYSYSVVHRAPTKELKDRVPYAIALVDLDEGPRLLTWIVDCDPVTVRIGLRVKADFLVGPGTRPIALFAPDPTASS